VVKGEVTPGEEARAAAAREFTEETGWVAPGDNWIDLGSVQLRSGKIVLAWAVEADFTEPWNPGTFRMFWHGRERQFPEIDQVRWCDPGEAARLLNPAQIELVTRLGLELNQIG
jgi:predicted NUDIX family NTP pyrophosphohydrolase